MPAAPDLRPTYCRPYGPGFVLDVLYQDSAGKPAGRMAVSEDELLHWAALAADYSPQFAQALQQRLRSISHTAKGGSDAVRQA